MKKHYHLPFLQTACFMFIILLLQSCASSHNLPLEAEQKPTETVEKIENQVFIIEIKEDNPLPAIMPELWQYIFSYLDFKGVLSARTVSADWNKLITGFREAGIVGVENKPIHIIDTQRWVKREEIYFTDNKNKLNILTPATIPSFAFCHLMGHVEYLPQRFWPYLPDTQVHTLSLNNNYIGAQEVRELAKVLPVTRVHTLNLNYNKIGAEGAIELARVLPNTRVHTLDLGYNEIGAEGAIELAKALPVNQLYTLYLYDNRIYGSRIGEAMQQLLKEQYPHIKWGF